MSPKPWRWTGRARTADEPEQSPDGGPGHLLELAAEHATGALHLNGRWGGTIFMIEGRIGYVESVLTPGMEALLLRPSYADERNWAELVQALRRGESAPAVARLRAGSTPSFDTEVLRRTASADAALAVLGADLPENARTRDRFTPNERHWCRPGQTLEVADVLAEVNRRKAVLARLTLGIQPDQAVRRVPQLPIARIRLTASQWNIVRLADGDSTPLDIAWMLGHGVFATTMAVHQLARLGILAVDSDPPRSVPEQQVPARHVLSFLQVAAAPASLS